MSKIKGKNTKPEMLLQKFLFANRYRYRLHDKKLPGKPDIACPLADGFYQNIKPRFLCTAASALQTLAKKIYF